MNLLQRLLGRLAPDRTGTGARPVALVYRGPAARPAGCPEAVADLLASSAQGFDVRFVGPREDRPLDATTLAGAALYAQPGGGELKPAWKKMRSERAAIRDYVRGGGRYLGFCLGGYLAGATPGFDLLPGDTDRWTDTRGATVRHHGDALVDVAWGRRVRRMYFQDGPHFVLEPGRPVHVLARYPNGAVAALVAPFGAGCVGVVGPHPEAGPDWFDGTALAPVDARDAGRELVDAVMAGGRAGWAPGVGST